MYGLEQRFIAHNRQRSWGSQGSLPVFVTTLVIHITWDKWMQIGKNVYCFEMFISSVPQLPSLNTTKIKLYLHASPKEKREKEGTNEPRERYSENGNMMDRFCRR